MQPATPFTTALGGPHARHGPTINTCPLEPELVHCHDFDLHSTVELVVETGFPSKLAMTVGLEVVNSRVEVLVDALADILAPSMPPFRAPVPK